MIKYTQIFIFIFISQCITAQGYNIKLTINGLKNSEIILGFYYAGSMQAFDTAYTNNQGICNFKGKEPIPSGIYFIYLPSRKAQDLLIDNNQSFQIITDTSFSNITYKNSLINSRFKEYQSEFTKFKKKDIELSKLFNDSTFVKSKDEISSQIKENRLAYERFISTTINYNKDNFLGYLIKSIQDIKVPEQNNEIEVKNENWQYYYYRDHYFDYFNISDPRLLRTPFYQEKIMTYLTKVCIQIPDSLIKQVDYLIEKTKNDSSTYQFMLITLLNYFAKSNIMGMDAVTIYIADKYYLKDSWWSNSKSLADIKANVEKTKPLLLGKIAPDIQLVCVPSDHFISAKNDTALRRYPHAGTITDLNSIEAKYLVLIFWEADCGHCQKAVPELYKIYETSLKSMDVKVLAVSSLFGEEGKIKWVNFVNENKLYDWINAWNPYSYDFKIKYDVVTTPQIFILDKDKKIIAKKIAPDQIVDFITAINDLSKTK